MTTSRPSDRARARSLGVLFVLALAIAPAARGARGSAAPAGQPPREGPVVLVGGRFEAGLPDGVLPAGGVGVLLLVRSSADPEPEAPPWAAALEPHVLDGRALRAERAPDGRPLPRGLGAPPCVVLAGGDFLAWWRALERDPHGRRLARELRRAHASGTALVGAGGGASWLAGAAILARDELPGRLRNPRADERATRLAAGLGLAGGFACELESLGGTLPRLLDQLAEEPVRRGLLLAEESVWRYEASAREGRVLAGAAWILDLARARRVGGALDGARLAVLGPGDRWSARSGRVELGGENHPLARSPGERALDAPGAGARELHALLVPDGAGTWTPARVRIDAGLLLLEPTALSRVALPADGPLRFAELRLDWRPRAARAR